MRSYRKKPVVIQAVQYRGGEQPGELAAEVVAGKVYYAEDGSMRIRTLEGELTASPGDFIIRGVKGELYPCKPDIFVATYDEVIPDRDPLPCAPEAPRGFAHLRFLVALAIGAVLVLCAPLLARGDSSLAPPPQFGASAAEWSIGPRVALPALKVNMRTGQADFGFIPGFGYGVERDGKIPMGLGLFLNVVSEDVASLKVNKVAPALMLDVMRYVHIGVGLTPWARGTEWYGLITLGTDLGASRP